MCGPRSLRGAGGFIPGPRIPLCHSRRLHGRNRAWRFQQAIEFAAAKPAFFVTTGDTIQRLNDNTAEAEWREARRFSGVFADFTFYLVPGNHDIWSDASEALYTRYSRRPLHYSFDYAQAHFTKLPRQQPVGSAFTR